MTTLTPPTVTTAPQIGAVTSYVKRSVRLAIIDSTERTPREYGKQEFRPEAVLLAWENSGDSPDWKLTQAEIIGSVWKADGTVGLVPARRNYAGLGRRISDAPEWLIELVLRHGPFASMAVTE